MLQKTLAAISLISIPLFAQAPAMPLSLKQAVDIALTPDGNTRAQIAKELIRQAEARSSQARAALLPNLDSYFAYQNQTRNLAAFAAVFARPKVSDGVAPRAS